MYLQYLSGTFFTQNLGSPQGRVVVTCPAFQGRPSPSSVEAMEPCPVEEWPLPFRLGRWGGIGKGDTP